MEATCIYGIVIAGIFLLIVLVNCLRNLAPLGSYLKLQIGRHLEYPYILRRHRLIGPWSRGMFCLQVLYISTNLVVLLDQGLSIKSIRDRGGSLALINLILPLSALHLSQIADILNLSLHSIRRLHRSMGRMSALLLLIHVAASFFKQDVDMTPINSENLSKMIGGASLGLLILLSLPGIRRLSYEIFLRLHQALSILGFYGIWQHVPRKSRFARLYVYVTVGIFGCTSILQVTILLYHNGLLSHRGSPRAIVTCKSAATIQKASIKIRLTLPRPIRVMPGQYINIWLPSVSIWSWLQTHPLTVTSWSCEKQEILELLIHPQRGQSASLFEQVRAIEAGRALSLMALYSGPHGISERVNDYENVILIASGSGLVAVIPYVAMLIHGYNTCTMHVRRIHLIWQVEELEFAISFEHMLNVLLKDDVLDDGYILNISIYIEHGILPNRPNLLFGRHDRAFLYGGLPDYDAIISSEASGKVIQGSSVVRDEHGRTLYRLWEPYGIRYEVWFDKTYPMVLVWSTWNINRK
ncbi:unnamed protein product [Penicillium salamii]|uniref:ferric-chelate reductase (NADPH) n=1 Tax=Penicillium salamii TaxID=1612424 RepID=A0A9W4JNR9_9EURO|nr:unnamed protein product [Penicillium salamii]